MRPRPERIDIRGMDYAPENEQGVVFLFALLAPQLGFRGLERIQQGFPDAIARKRGSRGEERVKIEFEYRSSSYRTHRHSRRRRITIVCWIHDWPGAPPNIEVLELRQKVGLSFDVWLQSVNKTYWGSLDRHRNVNWSVPSLSKRGDLIVFYRKTPQKLIQELYVQISPTRPDKEWRWGADLRRVYRLRQPVILERLRQDRGLHAAPFVRGNFQGRYNATAYWPALYGLIVGLNRSAAKPLRKYAPEYL